MTIFRPNTVARTKGGTPVEIVAILTPEQEDSHGDCIVGVMVSKDGSRELATWQRDGRFNPRRQMSLLDLEYPVIRALAEHELSRV